MLIVFVYIFIIFLSKPNIFVYLRLTYLLTKESPPRVLTLHSNYQKKNDVLILDDSPVVFSTGPMASRSCPLLVVWCIRLPCCSFLFRLFGMSFVLLGCSLCCGDSFLIIFGCDLKVLNVVGLGHTWFSCLRIIIDAVILKKFCAGVRGWMPWSCCHRYPDFVVEGTFSSGLVVLCAVTEA